MNTPHGRRMPRPSSQPARVPRSPQTQPAVHAWEPDDDQAVPAPAADLALGGLAMEAADDDDDEE